MFRAAPIAFPFYLSRFLKPGPRRDMSLIMYDETFFSLNPPLEGLWREGTGQGKNPEGSKYFFILAVTDRSNTMRGSSGKKD